MVRGPRLESFTSYPVDGDVLRGHGREISHLGEEVDQAQILHVFHQVVVLLQFKSREHNLTGPTTT